MRTQIDLGIEAFWTFVTCELVIAFVVRAGMNIHVLFFDERLVALWTFVRPNVLMTPQMRVQIGTLRKSFLTIWPSAGVITYVIMRL